MSTSVPLVGVLILLIGWVVLLVGVVLVVLGERGHGVRGCLMFGVGIVLLFCGLWLVFLFF